MKILVTGSNGFVGGDLASLLLRRGHFVVGLGRSPEPAGAVSEYLRRDLGEPLDWDGTVDAIVHCAALAAPWAPPAAFERANVEGTRHVVDWCHMHGRPHLVYISSSSVFYRNEDQLGLHEGSPIPEDREQINVYSRTKRIGERLVEAYEGEAAILRPRAVFGPGDRVLFPRVLRAARAGRLPLIRRPDGTPVLGDLLYVENLSHYIAVVLERRISGITGTLNLTNAEPVDLQAFLLRVLERLGYPAPRRQVPLGMAMALAGLSEWVSAVFLGYREPPVTRFGVSVFAYSKTFDVRRCLDLLGPPPVSLAEGVERLAAAWAGETS